MSSDELSWDQRILSVARPSIDPTPVAESLCLTPAERLDRLQRMLAFVEVARRRLPPCCFEICSRRSSTLMSDSSSSAESLSSCALKELLDLEEIAEIKRQSLDR
jgi:hypothetical protein